MTQSIELSAGRGTKLFRSASKQIELIIDTVDAKSIDQEKIMLIIGTKIDGLITLINESESGVLGMNGCEVLSLSEKSFKVVIAPQTEYMVINLTSMTISVKYSENPEEEGHHLLYDPYQFENEEKVSFDPEVFKTKHPEYKIAEGYVDTLAKWYSVKFTYENENWIYIRPGIGISFQTHKLRQEHWEVILGSPIILSGNRVYYDTKAGDVFDHPMGGLHTIINPWDEWVGILEKYTGEFDEEDIARIYNPNNYMSPKT